MATGCWLLAAGLWPLVPLCASAGRFLDPGAQAGYTKLGKIAGSFRDGTIHKQHCYLFCVFYVKVIFSKSRVHGPT